MNAILVLLDCIWSVTGGNHSTPVFEPYRYLSLFFHAIQKFPSSSSAPDPFSHVLQPSAVVHLRHELPLVHESGVRKLRDMIWPLNKKQNQGEHRH